MTTKRATCTTCNPNGSPMILDADVRWDENGDRRNVWVCRNCNAETHRRTRKPSARQQAVIDETNETIRSLGIDWPA